MPRMALRQYPDEREDIRKLRVVLRKAEDPPLDWRLRAVQILSEWTSIEQTAGMCQLEAMRKRVKKGSEKGEKGSGLLLAHH